VQGTPCEFANVNTTTALYALIARSDIDGSSVAISQNDYVTKFPVAETNSDHRLTKHVAGTPTDLGSEAYDDSGYVQTPNRLSFSGTTIKSYHSNDVGFSDTPKISVTDSSHSSGKYGWPNTYFSTSGGGSVSVYVHSAMSANTLLRRAT
jgi:hypothetical protein